MDDTQITYALSTIDNPDLLPVKALSKDEFLKYTKHAGELNKLTADENLFRIVELNHNELLQSIERYTIQFSNGLTAGEDEFENMVLDINRMILNLLSSIRTYLDHTETRLKRMPAISEIELDYFKQVVGKAYDENFSYRFLYKLRNYSQHCGLPAASITFNSREGSHGTAINTLSLFLKRDELLNNFDAWGTVKPELKVQSEEFDIIPLLNEKIQILKTINKSRSSKIYSYFTTQAQELFELMKQTQGLRGIPCLIKTTPQQEKSILAITWLPFEAISKITGIDIIINNENLS